MLLINYLLKSLLLFCMILCSGFCQVFFFCLRMRFFEVNFFWGSLLLMKPLSDVSHQFKSFWLSDASPRSKVNQLITSWEVGDRIFQEGVLWQTNFSIIWIQKCLFVSCILRLVKHIVRYLDNSFHIHLLIVYIWTHEHNS